MTTDRRRRSRPVQPELPLPSAEDTESVAVPRPVNQDDWRLDDRTRQLGRRGVAEARARLEGRTGTGAAA